jgi:hypothetical protein
MSIQTFCLNAADIFSLELKPVGRADVSFLNWHITERALSTPRHANKPLISAGPGIYGLCFNNELIYIGSYLGTGKHGAFFTGNVVTDRWWTHIGSITARGNRVHIARRSLDDLSKNPGSGHPLVAAFQQADLAILHKDEGNLAPLRRLRFAISNWDVFGNINGNQDDILGLFTYVYSRFDEQLSGLDPILLKDKIEEAERNLIKRYAPKCNTKHMPVYSTHERLDCNGITNIISAELGAAL